MTRVIEFWKNRSGKVFKITHNPCNCCPLDVMEETYIDGRYKSNFRFKKAVSYKIKSRSVFTNRLKNNGNVRLSREIVRL